MVNPGPRHPIRTAMIYIGICCIAGAGSYLVAGMAGMVPLELSKVTWTNIRVVAGAAIGGCLLVAIGFWNE